MHSLEEMIVTFDGEQGSQIGVMSGNRESSLPTVGKGI